MRRAGATCGAVVLALMAATPAGAVVVATPHDVQWPPVIDGDAVVWVQSQLRGDLLVRRAVPGEPAADVLRAPLPYVKDAVQAPRRLAAGPAGVALLRTAQTHRMLSDDSGIGMHLFDELLLAPRDGPPGSVARGDGCDAPTDAGVTDELVTVTAQCGTPPRAVVRVGERVVGTPTRHELGSVVAAGRFVAWHHYAQLVGRGPDEIVVFDRAAGAVVLRADLRPLRQAYVEYDLDPADGGIAIAYETVPRGANARTRLRLVVADPARPALRPLGPLRPAALTVAADGGRVAFVRAAASGAAEAVVATRAGRVLTTRTLAPRSVARRTQTRGSSPFALSVFLGLDLAGPTLAATVGVRVLSAFPWLRARGSRVLAWRLS